MYNRNSAALLSNWDTVLKIVEEAPEKNDWASDLHKIMTGDFSLLYKAELGIIVLLYQVRTNSFNILTLFSVFANLSKLTYRKVER